MIRKKTLVLTEGLLDTSFAKTCHGLLRGSDRFEVVAVVDPKFSGRDAGEVMDGKKKNIMVYSSIDHALLNFNDRPSYCVVGVATPGGFLPASMRKHIVEALENKLNLVSGLHFFLSEDPDLAKIAEQNGVMITDVRKPPPRAKLSFWTGEIMKVTTPKIAVLGTDCAVGKRTTCRMLLEMSRKMGMATEMIYTGQTGWMQGYTHGFIFDTIVNDFIGGEMEKAIVECDRIEKPDLIFIEGQSSLRNPAGPCGLEFIFSGNVKNIVLQHAPGRKYYEDTEVEIPPVESEVKLYNNLDVNVLAVSLNENHMPEEDLQIYQRELELKLHIPVIRPLTEGVSRLENVLKRLVGQDI